MKIGPYEIGDKLGTGTVADSFIATGGGSKPTVVKKLHDDLAANAKLADAFLDACNLSGKIRSRRFLGAVVMQKKSPEGVFLVREHVEGQSLAQLVADGRLATLDPKQLAFDLCDALRALHLQSIIHGGIHPGNIIVQDDGHLRLLDYGISRARLTGKVDDKYPLLALRYLAPEQWRGPDITPAADMYSAGLIVALLVSQKELTKETTFAGIKDRTLAGLTLPNAVLGQAAAREPGNRFKDAELFRAALREMFADPPPTAATTAPPPPPPVQEAPPPIAPPPTRQTPMAAPQRPKTAPPKGTLRAIKDLKTGTDLLALNRRLPWQLKRSAETQQWPIFLANGGPGNLELRLRCVGKGIRLTPTDKLRIKPNTSRYVIVTLDPQGSDFARLDIAWPGQKRNDRVEIRIYRPS